MIEPNYYPACDLSNKGETTAYGKPMRLLEQVLEEIAEQENKKIEVERKLQMLKDIYNNIKYSNFSLSHPRAEQSLE